jgi:putative ABC transport system substrate-binding protein
MNRREVLTVIGSAAAWLFAARAPELPVIGYLDNASAASARIDLDGFRQGLADAGLVEGRNVGLECRRAEGINDRLPGHRASRLGGLRGT